VAAAAALFAKWPVESGPVLVLVLVQLSCRGVEHFSNSAEAPGRRWQRLAVAGAVAREWEQQKEEQRRRRSALTCGSGASSAPERPGVVCKQVKRRGGSLAAQPSGRESAATEMRAAHAAPDQWRWGCGGGPGARAAVVAQAELEAVAALVAEAVPPATAEQEHH